MLNVFDVAQTLVNHIRERYSEDVALIAYYGSYAQGTATPRSDLDFFFIPASERGSDASVQFVLHDISFDFWPISWERAERMAKFEEQNTTIIADCEILYVRSEEDRTRFLQLRKIIDELPQQEQTFIGKAESQLREVYVHLYKISLLHEDDISGCRTEAHGVLNKLVYTLALLNRTYMTRGWGKNREQLLQFPLRPANLEEQIETISRASSCREIREACGQLTADTVAIVMEQRKTHASGPSYPDRAKGFYEEVKGIFDKIRTACEKNDYTTASYWSIGVQDEVAAFLCYFETGLWPGSLEAGATYHSSYTEAGLPDLPAHLDPLNLVPLHDAVVRLDQLLERHLQSKGVAINRFNDLAQFEQFLNERV
ncbi:nucleotidyltransferase domain-containing protein [Paenibacillus lignilyticus]|uniref:Nucleotidyltransferase domain-containing protein n=1 Tax=Paenibacillus lignilyticus TaxID=1172615 RepID=A0ABS5C9H2_9BACL|nr:nucleotidyltransferase domain-containing protein [Paenibacillus lignilyticus]MBP3962649.1 nucleotidyltransferase domain-containing protein [Paenibacillus lignilyticus]